MNFNTWDEVVTYVYWLNNQLPPTDKQTYNEEKEKIIKFHKEKGYPIPKNEKE